jgi:hypothetical protein
MVLDKDGDLTHAPEQWRNKAWFRPSVEAGVLVFRILGQQSVAMTTEVYAIYHGQLIEMLLAHSIKNSPPRLLLRRRLLGSTLERSCP